MQPDPRRLKDWEIAEAAEECARPIARVAEDAGLRPEEIVPMGRLVAKVDYRRVFGRLPRAADAKYVDVTAITPTPLGEGKTTTTIGLVQGLAKLGHRPVGAIRQPSSGPTFNIKGSAAGGGLAQCVPLSALSIRFTGDIDAVTNAHNLGMVALTARMQHERNYDDARLERIGLRRLDIDPGRVQWRWAMDFSAQALRRIVIGLGGPQDGVEMESGFQISVSSELMAILAIARDLGDLRTRIGRVVLAQDRAGRDITASDLEVAGAMTAWLVEALQPNLIQTLEGQPMLVHAGPFANIAIGQSSILADEIGVRLGDFLVTESGFGADIGYEKFWNLKCRFSGLRPHAVVLVATVRALKMHGGGPVVKPGRPLDEAFLRENLALLEAGCENLAAHLDIVRKSGVRPVVALNHFDTDTPAEIAAVRRAAERGGALFAVARHWAQGGEGARELAEAVATAASEPNDFHFLYEESRPLLEKIERIAREVYGADGVSYSDAAREKIQRIESDPAAATLGVCMAKTHLSLSHDPNLKGRPRGWTLPVRDLLVYRGAGFVVPVAGEIKLMPGTGSNPAFRRMDVDVGTGRVRGLF
jgi:formate--tetrahydrofolate ligase